MNFSFVTLLLIGQFHYGPYLVTLLVIGQLHYGPYLVTLLVIGELHYGPYLVMEALRRENVDLSMRKIFFLGLPLDTDPYQRCGKKKFQKLSMLLSIRPLKLHRRSVAVLCIPLKIKSNPMHPLSGALPLQCVPARVTRGALVAHRHSFAPPRVGLLSTAEPLYPSRRLFGTIWRVLRAELMLSCWPNLLFLFVYYCFIFFLPSMGWLCWFFGLIACSHSLPTLRC